MNAQHVPAWKKLGLKLKHANDHVTAASSEVNSNGMVKKRKYEQAGNTASDTTIRQPQLKRPCIATETSIEELRSEIPDTGLNGHSIDTPKPKKSVTFTPDTKAQDGDSAQTIQFWVPDFSGSTYEEKTIEDVQNATTVSDKKPKKVKKPKSQRYASEHVTPRKATVALDYLNRFRHQRSSWKFNKNHETWILRHALSTEEIPSQYNLALASYLNGLKSVGARQRLVQQSQQALRLEDVTEESSDGKSKKILLQILEDGTADDNDEQPVSQFHKLGRAKLVLWSLGQDLQHSRTTGGTRTNGQVVSRVKKNKSRTSRIEIESSSSSGTDTESEKESTTTSGSDSDSDSDSDSEERPSRRSLINNIQEVMGDGQLGSSEDSEGLDDTDTSTNDV